MPSGRDGVGNEGRSSSSSSSSGGGWGGSASGNANSPNAGGGRSSSSSSSSSSAGAGRGSSPGASSSGGYSPSSSSAGAGRGSSPGAESTGGYSPSSSAGAGRGSSPGAERTGGYSPSGGIGGREGSTSGPGGGANAGGGFGPSPSAGAGRGSSAGAERTGGFAPVSSVGAGRGLSSGSPTTGGYNPVSQSYQRMADSMSSVGVRGLSSPAMQSGLPTSGGLFSAFDPRANGIQAGFTTDYYDPKKSDFASGMIGLSANAPQRIGASVPASWTATSSAYEPATTSGRPGAYGLASAPATSNAMAAFERISGPEGTRGAAGYTTGYGNVNVPGLTDMTVAQVLEYGPKHSAKYGSSALGKAQVMNATLKDYVKSRGIDVNTTKFDQKTQDDIVAWAMDRRAAQASRMPGGLNADNLGKAFAQEWAGLATSTGKSYYAGDGRNKAGNTWADTKAIAQSYIDGLNAKNSNLTGFNADRTGLMAASPAQRAINDRIAASSTTENAPPSTASASVAATPAVTASTANAPATTPEVTVAVDENGVAAPVERTTGQTVAAGLIDVAVTVKGGLIGGVAQIAAQSILGKTVGEVVVDAFGNSFTLNGNGTLSPVNDENRLCGDSDPMRNGSQDKPVDEPKLVEEEIIKADPVARIGTVYLGHPLDKYIGPSGGLFTMRRLAG